MRACTGQRIRYQLVRRRTVVATVAGALDGGKAGGSTGAVGRLHLHVHAVARTPVPVAVGETLSRVLDVLRCRGRLGRQWLSGTGASMMTAAASARGYGAGA